MIPDTKNGLPAMACVSAMQKSIRRGMEREAMEFACELIHTSQGVSLDGVQAAGDNLARGHRHAASPMIVPFVATAVAQAKRWYDPEKLGARGWR